MDGGGIGEHVGAVPEDGQDLGFRARELRAQRGAGAPTETGRGTRAKIEIRSFERAIFREQRVFVDHDAARILGALNAAMVATVLPVIATSQGKPRMG